MTRPDLSFVVQVLSQYMHAPKQSHLDIAARVVRYIKRTTGFSLLMPANGELNLVPYCDSDWVLVLKPKSQ